MNFPSLSDVDLAGKRVFIRADFNVPLNADGSLSDDELGFLAARAPWRQRFLFGI